MRLTSYLCRAVRAMVLNAPTSDSAYLVKMGIASGSREFFKARRYIWISDSTWVLSGPSKISFFT